MNVTTALEEKIVLLIASAKIPEREGSISPSSFYGQLPVFSLIYRVDEFSFKEVKTWGQSIISSYYFVFSVNKDVIEEGLTSLNISIIKFHDFYLFHYIH